jgi:hypothetical protein
VPASQVPALTAQRAFAWDAATLPDGHRPNLDELLGRRLQTRFGGETMAIAATGDAEAASSAGPPASTLAWDRQAGIYRFAGPGACVLVGLLGGRGATTVDGLTVTVAPSVRNFASLALVSMDGKPVREAATLLLTAIDKAENRGVQWNPEHTFAKEAWKYGPVQVTGVSAEVRIPTAARRAAVYALDPTGKRSGPVPAEVKDGLLVFKIGPNYQTIWYEITTK